MTDELVSVRYLGSVYVPGEECSFCCFEARDAETVREANRRADDAVLARRPRGRHRTMKSTR